MADIGNITVPMKQVVAGIEATITVKGQRQFNVRMWIAIKLVQLAALVLPFKADVEVDLR